MFGDMGPVFALPPPPSPNGAPAPIAPQAFGRAIAAKGKEVLPWVRADKMAENMSPVPQDRVFFTFNYFNNVNYAINGRIGSPYSNMQIQRYQLGLEKTFWDGNASIGFRDTLNTMSANSLVRGLGGTSSALGDLNVFTKFVLWQSWEEAGPRGTGAYPFAPGQANGGLISAGLSLNFPTGPGAFAGSPGSTSFRDTQLQPFVGYFWSRNRVYLLGFEEINVPLDPNDVTMLFTDIGTGYFYYKSPDPNSFLSAASATFEVHVNDPLNHRHPYSVTDLAGTADVLDFTYGTSLFLGQRALFSTAIVTPVTGPRPFNFEVLALFNIYFGKSTRAQRASSPLNMGN